MIVRRPLPLLVLLLIALAACAQANPPATPPVPPPARLTLKDAETLAAKNNPLITVGKLTALASQQVVRESRSAYWPTAVVDVTGVDAQENSRITAGGLNNPIIYPRAAAGTIVSQLITDFGRTRNLVASSSFHAKAENENAAANALQIKLAVDQAFYNALQTRAVLQVAQETVAERQTVTDQVQALFNSKLKSSLDLSFAQVNLAQAKLLLLDAQNNENAALADLSAVLGYPTLQNYDLVEETTPLNAPTADVDQLIVQAMQKRPELAALNYDYQAAQQQLRDLQDSIARDVRTGWLNATTAYQRLSVSQQLLQQANLALDLSQTRYKLGLASIVELSQAQLQQTQAQIGSAQATYQYRLALAVLNFQIANF